MPIIVFYKGLDTSFISASNSYSKMISFDSYINKHPLDHVVGSSQHITWSDLCIHYMISSSKSGKIVYTTYNEGVCEKLKKCGETIISIYPSKDIKEEYLSKLSHTSIDEKEYKDICDHYYRMIRTMYDCSTIRYPIYSCKTGIESTLRNILNHCKEAILNG